MPFCLNLKLTMAGKLDVDGAKRAEAQSERGWLHGCRAALGGGHQCKTP